jgi:hypothetical protein
MKSFQDSSNLRLFFFLILYEMSMGDMAVRRIMGVIQECKRSTRYRILYHYVAICSVAICRMGGGRIMSYEILW